MHICVSHSSNALLRSFVARSNKQEPPLLQLCAMPCSRLQPLLHVMLLVAAVAPQHTAAQSLMNTWAQ